MPRIFYSSSAETQEPSCHITDCFLVVLQAINTPPFTQSKKVTEGHFKVQIQDRQLEARGNVS